MNPLDSVKSEQLLRFLRINKTKLSCLEEPHTFIHQLRDHDLIPEKEFEKVIHMRSKETIKKALYELLDYVETEQSHRIHVFWKCIFKDTVMNEYIVVRLLRNSLMTTLHNSSCDGEGQKPGPSSQATPRKRKRSGEMDSDENGESERQTEQQQEENRVFRVSCEDLAGTLHQRRFGSGRRGKCIRTDSKWFSPVEFVAEATRHRPDATWKKDIMCDGESLIALIEAKILNVDPLLCKCRACSPNPTDQKNQENDDECWVCKRKELKLVMCDDCPRSFHQKCHLPHIPDTFFGDGKRWMCTFCVASQEWRLSDAIETDAAMSHRVRDHMLTENDSTANQTLGCLDTVTEKLQKNEYGVVREFESDIQLLFTNSASNNQDKPEHVAQVEQLKELFSLEFTKVFNIAHSVD